MAVDAADLVALDRALEQLGLTWVPKKDEVVTLTSSDGAQSWTLRATGALRALSGEPFILAELEIWGPPPPGSAAGASGSWCWGSPLWHDLTCLSPKSSFTPSTPSATLQACSGSSQAHSHGER